MNKIIITIVIVAVALLGMVWFLGQSSQDKGVLEENMLEEEGAMIEEEGAKMEENSGAGKIPDAVMPIVKEFNVSGTEFAFSVPEMKVKIGDTVRVNFRNAGAMPHDFVIDEFATATKVLSPGGQETIEFTIDQVG